MIPDRESDVDRDIYLDNNSTTPLDPAVLEAMLPYFTRAFGNPSNTTHGYGVEAADAVERARSQVAALIGARPKEIVFTSGATESNNLAILGVVRRNRERGDHIITVKTEHKAVLMPCKELEREGFRVTYLSVDPYGRVTPEAVEEAITDRTLLVSVMAANNEVGTLQPIAEIGHICKERGVVFHSDAAQALGKIPFDVEQIGVDLVSISGHKMYGPKGVGALYIRMRQPQVRLAPLVHGGGQEGGLRSGTVPVPNVIGLGIACELAIERLPSESVRFRELQERLRTQILRSIPIAQVHGHPTETIPGLLSVGFQGVDGDVLIHSLQGVAISQGSSCSAGSYEPSHVLRAMGVCDDLAKATVRFGIGRFNAEAEIDRAAELVSRTISRLGGLASTL